MLLLKLRKWFVAINKSTGPKQPSGSAGSAPHVNPQGDSPTESQEHGSLGAGSGLFILVVMGQ